MAGDRSQASQQNACSGAVALDPAARQTLRIGMTHVVSTPQTILLQPVNSTTVPEPGKHPSDRPGSRHRYCRELISPGTSFRTLPGATVKLPTAGLFDERPNSEPLSIVEWTVCLSGHDFSERAKSAQILSGPSAQLISPGTLLGAIGLGRPCCFRLLCTYQREIESESTKSTRPQLAQRSATPRHPTLLGSYRS